MSTKRLQRSRQDRLIGGVCAGIANYFAIDPTLVRLLFVGLIFIGIGSPFLLYLLLWLIMPLEEREEATPQETVRANVQEMVDSAKQAGQQIRDRIGGSSQAQDGSQNQ